MLIACDGLWKTFDNKAVMEFVDKTLMKVAKERPVPSLASVPVQRSQLPAYVYDDDAWQHRWEQV